MWKASVGHKVNVSAEAADDWETDPDFVNDITEEEQRWGAKSVAGSGRPLHVNINQLRSNVSKEHENVKRRELEDGPRASYGYGGQFGTEQDRMDKSALGHEYKAEPEKHSSQTDASKGFGGKYGVQKDRTDKSAVGFEYKTQLQQHSSQQDHSQGFGGKFGVQKDRQDKSAHCWNYKEELQPHQSQTDYSQGFGGKFGVQKDRQDKSAHSWNHKEEIHPHQSQTDCAKGFGGRYGVQTDRVDKCASGFGDIESPTSAYQKTQPLEALTSGAQDLRSRFENIARTAEVENKLRAEEERVRRQKREKQELDHQHNNVPVVTPSECPAPVPRPRVSVFAAQEHAAPQITLDQEHEAPPVVPPKCFIVEEQFQPPPSEIFTDEAEYEAIPSPNNEIDEEYEAVPDLPPRAELEESETYEKILEAPVRAEDVLYEELQNSDAEAVMKGPSFQSGQVGATGISALAIYDYEGSGDDEISFQPADLITDIEMVDEGWWSGTCGGRRGLFPANYVQLVQ